MATSLTSLRQEVMKLLGVGWIGTATGGSVTTLTDTDWVQDSGASTRSFVGAWLFRPTAAAADQVRRITTYASGTFTHGGANYATAPVAADAYEVHVFMAPGDFNSCINRALQRRFYWDYAWLSLIDDADMEASGVTDWTATNTTLTKATTAGVVSHGAQVLRAVNSAANGRAASITLPCTPGEVYFLDAWCMPNGDYTATLIAYDVTNSANIKTVSYAGREPKRLWLSFTVPTGCERMAVWLRGDDAAADIYWDNVLLYANRRRQYWLPSWLTEARQVARLEHLSARSDEAANISFDLDGQWLERSYQLYPSFAANHPLSILLSFYPQGPARVVALRPFASLSAETSTTTMDLQWAAWISVVEIIRTFLLKPTGDRGDYPRLLALAQARVHTLDKLHMPAITRRPFLAEPYSLAVT